MFIFLHLKNRTSSSEWTCAFLLSHSLPFSCSVCITDYEVVMTSLAHQLKRLALPQNDASLLTRKEIASLLFDPKDAATIDRSTFYALGE